MMAAPVVRNGVARINIDSHSAILPSQHSSSMHESSVTTPSSALSTTMRSSLPVNNNEEQEESKLGSNDHISSISPAGKKLAVSCGQGPSASLVSSSSLIHEDETDIALSQLEELEVAIKVRKVTRVDGRKTRWIEYRREKQADIQAKQKLKSKGYSSKTQRKREAKTKKIVKVKVGKAKRHATQNLKDHKVAKPLANGEPMKKVYKIKEDSMINNNNIDNNKNKIDSTMKVEISSPLISSTLGTHNVLETMKQQFLQGTVDIPASASDGVKEKASKKLAKSTNGTVPQNHINNENFKRKVGRPKKLDNMKVPSSKLNGKVEAPSPSQPIAVGSIPAINKSSGPLAIVTKRIDLPPMAQSTTDFYARRNLLTKGLREVRKSESGSESGGSSPIKDGSPSLSPSPQLTLSPISSLTPISSEPSHTTNTTSLKCPLVATVAQVISSGAKKPKITNGFTTKKRKGLKMSKKENINLNLGTNGHNSIQNSSASKRGKSGLVKGIAKSIPVLKKRGKGRKPKCKVKEVSHKWSKTTSTIIADVHNTMNGEPQTVIPVQNPILLRTKKSLTPTKLYKLSNSESEEKTNSKNMLLDSIKLNSNRVNEFVPPVPEVACTTVISRSSSPSFISSKLSNSESASKVNQTSDSGKSNSTKTESNADDLLKVESVPEILGTPLSSSTPVVQNSIPEKVDDQSEKKNGETKDEPLKVKVDSSAQLKDENKLTIDVEASTLQECKIEKSLQTNSIENSHKMTEPKQTDIKKVDGHVYSLVEVPKQQNQIISSSAHIAIIAKCVQPPKECIDSNIASSNLSFETDETTVSRDSSVVVSSVEKTPSKNKVNAESEVQANKAIQFNASKGSLANKIQRKTPEKAKNKTLNAVIEKLSYPTRKKASSDIEKPLQTELTTSSPTLTTSATPSITQTQSINEDALKESLPTSLTTSDNVQSILYNDLEKELNKVNDLEPVEKGKVKSPQQSINQGMDKAPLPSIKPKEKLPRFLKQLFQDEGVQNMLRSVNEEVIPNEGNSNVDFSSHKLRPKRAQENLISDSPEPDDSLLISNSKRKKRGTEVDNLFVDEGALNLLTSLEVGSRRPLTDDATIDTLQPNSLKIPNPIPSKNAKGPSESCSSEPPRKRKFSENNIPPTPIIIGKVLQPPEKEINKKVKLDLSKPDLTPTTLKSEPEKKNSVLVEPKIIDGETLKKKPGRPSLTIPLKQKTREQIILYYKKHLSKLGIPSDNLSVTQMREVLNEAKGQHKPSTVKSVPPIKIKIPSAHEKIVKQIPHSQESPNKQHSAGQEKATKSIETLDKRVEIPKNTEPTRSPSSHTLPSSHTEGTPSSCLARIPKTSTGNIVPSISSNIRSQPPDKPKNYHTLDNRSSPKYISPGPPRKAVSFAHSSPHPQITSLVRPLELSSTSQRGKVKGPGEGVRQSQRTSVRQSEGSYHYRDISLRKYNNFMQIILTPSTTKMKNSLNSRVLRELCEALSTLRRDDSVRMVLLTATGSTFCQGIDLTSLQHPNQDTRKKNAENLARGIKDFLRALVQFPKVIVAGVNGSAMGLGVTMLPLFDMVFATDKAEFFLPYAKLGQVPEGGATYTFPNYYGKLQSNKLFLGQKITATQAQQIGLISESIWPATFFQELIPKVAMLASQSQQSMEGTKALMNHHIHTKLELTVESECRLLLQQWTSPNFAHLCKRFLDASDVQLQKPVNLPL